MFLGETQKNEILRELKFTKDTEQIAQDIQEKGVESEFIDFIDPSNQQIAIKVGKHDWIYSEQRAVGYSYKDSDIDVEDYFTETMRLEDYTEAELRKDVVAYYSSLEKLKEEVGESWEQIALECVFEQM